MTQNEHQMNTDAGNRYWNTGLSVTVALESCSDGLPNCRLRHSPAAMAHASADDINTFLLVSPLVGKQYNSAYILSLRMNYPRIREHSNFFFAEEFSDRKSFDGRRTSCRWLSAGCAFFDQSTDTIMSDNLSDCHVSNLDIGNDCRKREKVSRSRRYSQ